MKDESTEDHYLPSGALVAGYRGQLRGSRHKFGSHTLTRNCSCGPCVDTRGASITVQHHDTHL